MNALNETLERRRSYPQCDFKCAHCKRKHLVENLDVDDPIRYCQYQVISFVYIVIQYFFRIDDDEKKILQEPDDSELVIIEGTYHTQHKKTNIKIKLFTFLQLRAWIATMMNP